MTKIIQGFNIDLSSMAAAGATRSFQVIGDNGAIFSLEVTNEDGHYYNFTTNTFAATHKRLKNKKVDNGTYNGSITFPKVGDPDQYNIYLFAESMHDTTHTDYSEVRFGDGSIDINSSIGSNSNLLKKVIYQYDDVTATLSARSPSASHHGTGNFVSMVVATDSIVTGRGNTVGKTAFSIGVTVAATKALQINRQPTIDDLTAYTGVQMGSGVKIPGEDIWTGAASSDTVDGAITDGLKVVMDANVATNMTVGDRITATVTTDTVDGAVTSGVRVTMDSDTATKMAIGDRVTGNHDLDTRIVTVAAILDSANFNMSEAIAIADGITLTFSSELNRKEVTVVALDPDEDNVKEFSMSDTIDLFDGMTLTFTSAKYYRWSIDSGSSIHTLLPGMAIVDTDGAITGSTIGSYTDTTTYTTEINNEDGSIEEVTNTITNVSIPALDSLGYKPTITNGVITKQLGYITFNGQIENALAAQDTFFYAYGSTAIKSIHDTTIKLTDLKVELTVPTTTVTSDSADTTIPVADREGVINNVSTINGIGIDASVANPVITSGGGTDGAGDWTIGVAQVLESGITLTVGNTSRVATITGNIEFVNVDDTNFTLYFDVGKFLSTS